MGEEITTFQAGVLPWCKSKFPDHGDVAQQAEHIPDMDKVGGSIPSVSTHEASRS